MKHQKETKESRSKKIEELRFAIGVREWKLYDWRMPNYVHFSEGRVTPDDLANLAKLEQLLYQENIDKLCDENSATMPIVSSEDDSMEAEEAMIDWMLGFTKEALTRTHQELTVLIGFDKKKADWIARGTEVGYEVVRFENFLLDAIHAGRLVQCVEEWHLESEEERNSLKRRLIKSKKR